MLWGAHAAIVGVLAELASSRVQQEQLQREVKQLQALAAEKDSRLAESAAQEQQMRQQLDHLRDQMQQTGAYVQAACGRHAVVAQARRLANATTCNCDKTADAYGTGECPPPTPWSASKSPLPCEDHRRASLTVQRPQRVSSHSICNSRSPS